MLVDLGISVVKGKAVYVTVGFNGRLAVSEDVSTRSAPGSSVLSGFSSGLA